ncbi:hypothetical protein ACOSQ2_020954 [Xanthoceras sorbifolium]
MQVLILLAIILITSSHREEVLVMEEITPMVEVEVEVGMVEGGITIIDHVKSVGEVVTQANLLQSTAYYATPETVRDQSWYADSRATNHVTSDLGNLSVQAEYRGNDRLVVCNGQQLNISHIDASITLSSLIF